MNGVWGDEEPTKPCPPIKHALGLDYQVCYGEATVELLGNGSVVVTAYDDDNVMHKCLFNGELTPGSYEYYGGLGVIECCSDLSENPFDDSYWTTRAWIRIAPSLRTLWIYCCVAAGERIA